MGEGEDEGRGGSRFGVTTLASSTGIQTDLSSVGVRDVAMVVAECFTFATTTATANACIGWAPRRPELLTLVVWTGEQAAEIRRRVTEAREAHYREQLSLLHDTAAATLLLVADAIPTCPKKLAARARRDLHVLRASHAVAVAGRVDICAAIRDEVAHITAQPVFTGFDEYWLDRRIAGPVLAAAREALTNVDRHAQASVVNIDVHAGSIRIVDDGIGISIKTRTDRYGLRESIIGRMDRAGGSATVAASHDGGIAVELRWDNRRNDVTEQTPRKYAVRQSRLEAEVDRRVAIVLGEQNEFFALLTGELAPLLTALSRGEAITADFRQRTRSELRRLRALFDEGAVGTISCLATDLHRLAAVAELRGVHCSILVGSPLPVLSEGARQGLLDRLAYFIDGATTFARVVVTASGSHVIASVVYDTDSGSRVVQSFWDNVDLVHTGKTVWATIHLDQAVAA